MVKLFSGILRVAGDVKPQLSVNVLVYLRKYYGRMSLTTAEHLQSVHSRLCVGAVKCAYRQGYKSLVGMKSGVVIAQSVQLKLLNRLDYRGSQVMLSPSFL